MPTSSTPTCPDNALFGSSYFSCSFQNNPTELLPLRMSCPARLARAIYIRLRSEIQSTSRRNQRTGASSAGAAQSAAPESSVIDAAPRSQIEDAQLLHRTIDRLRTTNGRPVHLRIDGDLVPLPDLLRCHHDLRLHLRRRIGPDLRALLMSYVHTEKVVETPLLPLRTPEDHLLRRTLQIAMPPLPPPNRTRPENRADQPNRNDFVASYINLLQLKLLRCATQVGHSVISTQWNDMRNVFRYSILSSRVSIKKTNRYVCARVRFDDTFRHTIRSFAVAYPLFDLDHLIRINYPPRPRPRKRRRRGGGPGSTNLSNLPERHTTPHRRTRSTRRWIRRRTGKENRARSAQE